MFRFKRICVMAVLLAVVSSSNCFANINETELPKAVESEQLTDETTKDALAWDGFKTDLDQTQEPTRSNLTKQFLVALGLVALLGYGTFYFSKKIAPKLASSKGKGMSITDSLSLGQNKTLHIVEIGNKKLLVGCTANSINTLSELPGAFQEALQTYQGPENEA